MSLSVRAPYAYIELILKRHLKKLKSTKGNFDKKGNCDLEFYISQFNERKKYLYIKALPAIMILIAAFLQVIEKNPYWDKFPPLVAVVSLYILIQLNLDIFKIKRNIRKVESGLSENKNIL